MGDRYSTAKVDFGLLTNTKIPLFMNKQSQRYFSLRESEGSAELYGGMVEVEAGTARRHTLKVRVECSSTIK